MIINQNNISTKDRINSLLRHTKTFDCFVGYFHISGFHQIYDSLQNVEKIRILIGIATGEQTYQIIQKAKNINELVTNEVQKEFKSTTQNPKIELGVKKFIQWIKENKLEIRAYPEANAHAKLYIMNFFDDEVDIGRVITGSSNLTYSALRKNLEIDVELSDLPNLKNAQNIFETYWNQSVEVNLDVVDTIQKKTWFNSELTPYEVYLKIIYEYFYNKSFVPQDDEIIHQKILKTVEHLNPELFSTIKTVSNQLRICKEISDNSYKNCLISCFISNQASEKMRFFYSSNLSKSTEICFKTAMQLIESDIATQKQSLSNDYYSLLEKNKMAFEQQVFLEYQKISNNSCNAQNNSEFIIQIITLVHHILKLNPFMSKMEHEFCQKLIQTIEKNNQIDDEILKQIKNHLQSFITKNSMTGFNQFKQTTYKIQELISFDSEEKLSEHQNLESFVIEYDAIFSILLI